MCSARLPTTSRSQVRLDLRGRVPIDGFAVFDLNSDIRMLDRLDCRLAVYGTRRHTEMKLRLAKSHSYSEKREERAHPTGVTCNLAGNAWPVDGGRFLETGSDTSIDL